jgi:hypothetical protein
MPDDIVAIARAAYETYVTKDRAAIEKLIAPDFHFTSPLDNRIDRATYLARCWPNSERISGFDFINLVPDRDRYSSLMKVAARTGMAFATPRLSPCAIIRSSRSRSISVGQYRTKRNPVVS